MQPSRFVVGCAVTALVFAGAAGAQDTRTISAEAPKVDFTGKVGECAAGCRITVYHSLGVQGTVEPVAGGLTDRDGAFHLRDVPWFRSGDWAYDYVVVAAQTDKRAGLLQIRRDDEHSGVEMALRATCRMRGVVCDVATGRPIAGASVWPMIFGNPDTNEPLVWPTAAMVPWQACTDAEGRFALESLAGAIYEVRTVVEQGPTVVAPRILVEAGKTVGDVDLRLCATGSVIGRLVDAATGESIATDGTAVLLAQGAADEGQRIDSRARIQADGSFRIEVAPSRSKLLVSVPGWTAPVRYATVVEGEATTLVVRLQKGERQRRR